MFHPNQKIEIRHATDTSGWQCILGKKKTMTRMASETWFPQRALFWEPLHDVWRVLALELVAASDGHRKCPTTNINVFVKSIEVI